MDGPLHRRALSTVTTMLLFIVGCGGGGGASRGVVRFTNGQPVQSGSVEFRSLTDGSRYASRIGVDGSFELTDAEGRSRCPPGVHEVVVVQIVLTEDLAAEAHRHGQTVPRRYADYYTSGLRVDVPAAAEASLVVTVEPQG